ncbi:MAG: penicillin-binding protein 2 [Parcubacteria group bacterium]|nr:penicillin-binding protein 2 [Parcubacteria group bacterium]
MAHDGSTFRVRFLYIPVFLLAGALVGKLFFVQMLYGSELRERAAEQYIAPVAQAFDRGSIFFERKDGTLFAAATQKSGFTVALNPSEIADAAAVFRLLVPLLPNLDETAFFLKAGKRNDPYEEIAWRIPEENAVAIEEARITGVHLYRDKWRFYPSGTLAAQALGFVGFDGKNLSGRYGVERYYNDSLERDANTRRINFFAEMFANIGRSFLYTRESRTGDVVLTIEPEVERFVEAELAALSSRWRSRAAGAIVIEPKTGALRALAAYPTFDLNSFQSESDYAIFGNPLVENVYELGSIMKPLTLAAGFDAGVVAAETTYYDRGYVLFDGARIENFDGKGRGTVDMQHVLNESLNTGAVYVMQQLGGRRFADYLLAFGLGEETGIDVPNETHGLVGNLSSSRTVEYATASFGQGIAVTPIAMARALSALANGGVLVTPHVVDRVVSKIGSTHPITYGGETRVIKKEAADEITRMLVKVVDVALAGGTVKLAGYSVAAKTGTAQIARPQGGGYYEDRFLHSFFGYFPAYDPRFLIFFFMVEPQGVRYASETLTKPFMDTVKFLINYYEIPPDR